MINRILILSFCKSCHPVFKLTFQRTSKGGSMDLRVGGVYCLPNGRELIVLCRRQNGHVSYRLSYNASQYEVSAEGRLVCDGKLTAWDISNLTDTGRSVGVERSPTLTVSHDI